MVKMIYLFFCVPIFLLAGCSKDDLIQEKESPITKASSQCAPSLSLSALSISEGPLGTYVDWSSCTALGHQHKYTLDVTGSLSGTYTASRPPIIIPYLLNDRYYMNLTLSTIGSYGTTERINHTFIKKNGIMTSSDPCDLNFPTITGNYAHYLNMGSSYTGDLVVNIYATQFNGGQHRSFRVTLYNLINGVPTTSFEGDYLYDGHSVNLRIPNISIPSYQEFKVRIDPYDCYPIPNTLHYMYGDLSVSPGGIFQTEIKFHKVNRISDGNRW